MAAPDQPLAVYYHTHWDREWYMPFRAYQVRLAEVVDEILDRLDRGILPFFTLDGQTVVLDDYLELRPENRSRLEHYIRGGQLSIGPWYVMPDEFLVGGESLIRNLQRGIRQSRAWGYDSFTGYLPDTFGHSADMPTLFQGFGIDSAIVWRGVNPRQSLFQWQSPSGAAVRTLHLTEGYFQMMLDDWTLTEPERQAQLTGTVEKLQVASPAGVPALLPIGADHMGPVPEAGHHMLRSHYPAIQQTTPDQYMASLNGQALNLESIQGELMDNTRAFVLPGVWSARLYLKQQNRRLEHALVHRLEPLLAMAQTLLPDTQRPRYPQHELEVAWKTLMLNHPHDSICGCSVDAVHRENEVRFDEVRQLTDAMQVRAEHALRQLSTADEWVVFNTGDQPYTGVVPLVEDVVLTDGTASDESASASASSRLTQLVSTEIILDDPNLVSVHHIPMAHLKKQRRTGYAWVEGVPAKGLTCVSKAARPAFQAVQVSENRLENEHLTVQLNPDGTLTVTDRQTGIQSAPVLAFDCRADQGDSYNSAPSLSAPDVRPLRFQEAMISLEGPLVAGWTLRHQLPAEAGTLMLETTVRLEAGSRLLEFETALHHDMCGFKVQVRFPTGQPIRTVTAESHLGLVTRMYDPDFRETAQMPVAKLQEIMPNTGPVQRFFAAIGQAWLTEGLTEYDVAGDTVAITLLRAFAALSSDVTGVRGAQAGPPLATPEGQCQDRPLSFRYAWLPAGEVSTDLYEAASRFYGTIWGVSGTGATPLTPHLGASSADQRSLIPWDNPLVVSSACYWLPGRGLVLRILNPNAQPETVRFQPGFATRAVQMVNFLEEVQQTLPEPVVTVGPHGVATLLFEV